MPEQRDSSVNVISEFPKNNKGEVVRVGVRDKNYLDIRTWFIADDGELRPGKGFVCHIDKAQQVADAIKEVIDMRESGVL